MEPSSLRELNPFEQTPNLYKLYTQLVYVFSVEDETSYPRISETLSLGLQRLTDGFPWIAGQVVNEGARNGSSGTYSVRALNERPRLVIKDLRSKIGIPTLEELRAAGYPVAMFNEDPIAPRKTLEMALGSATDPAEVFALQANYITGGLLLTIATQHNVMDMTGQAEFTRLLSKACRGEAFTSEELRNGNFSSAGVIKLLDDSVDVRKIVLDAAAKPNPVQLPTTTTTTITPSVPPECSWVYVNFTSSHLADLKAEAGKNMTAAFISTNDALTALIWQATTRARLPRLSASQSVSFARAIDPRRHLKELSPTYPGLIQNMAFSTSTVSDLVHKPLGSIASLLRTAIDPQTSDLERETRALATLLNKSEDKSSVNVTSSLDFSTDIMLSSWAAVKCYDDDFGLGLGRPEMVRRPGFTPVESLMYLLPRTPGGDVTAMMCLRSEDLERLKGDGEFARFGRVIG
jgi:hypothetical protein